MLFMISFTDLSVWIMESIFFIDSLLNFVVSHARCIIILYSYKYTTVETGYKNISWSNKNVLISGMFL